MYMKDLVQIKLQHCLLHYDLDDEKEVSCLNNYQGVFDNPQQFVLTPFFIPVRNGGQPTNKYIEMSHNQTFVMSYEDNLMGRIYNMHDELSLHNLKSISKRFLQNKKIKRIDLALSQSTYMGESVFHLCFNNFDILEKFHKQLCGTINPGEAGEIFDVDPAAAGGERRPGSHFEKPTFRRVVQLLIRKNKNGDSPLNLAIRNKNFRCFELMLSILLNAGDVFISRNFLNDLSFMIELEASTVEQFFERKLVDNFASKAIEKVKWTIDEESIGIVHSSQLFSKALIEKHTAPDEEESTEVK